MAGRYLLTRLAVCPTINQSPAHYMPPVPCCYTRTYTATTASCSVSLHSLLHIYYSFLFTCWYTHSYTMTTASCTCTVHPYLQDDYILLYKHQYTHHTVATTASSMHDILCIATNPSETLFNSSLQRPAFAYNRCTSTQESSARAVTHDHGNHVDESEKTRAGSDPSMYRLEGRQRPWGGMG